MVKENHFTGLKNIELEHASAAQIGQSLHSNKGGAVEVAKFFLERIEAQTSPTFLTVTRERALVEAQASDIRLASGRTASP